MLGQAPNIPPHDLWAGPPPAHATLGYTAGLFNSLAAAGATLTADRVYLVPAVVSRVGTYSGISLHVDTGVASSNARVGIYADGGAGRPGALIEEAGTLTPTTTAFYDIVFGGGNRTLAPGLYWLALLADTNGASATWEQRSMDTAQPIAMYQGGTGFSSRFAGFVSQAYASGLPASIGALTYTGKILNLTLKVAA